MAKIINALGEKFDARDILSDEEIFASEKLQNALTYQQGYEVDVTTLTALSRIIAEQKFYEIPFADYVPTRVNTEAAYAQNIINYRSFAQGGDFEEGYIDQGVSSRLAQTDVAIDAVTSLIRNWAKENVWGLLELAQASRAGNWDIYTAKEKSRKKNWDLGLQQIAFLGSQGGLTTGIANTPNVTTDTSLVPVPLSEMTLAQINDFVRGAINGYRANSNYTAYPDVLYIPETDYNGLNTYVEDAGRSATFTRLEMLRQAFVGATRNSNFRILPLVYLEGTFTGTGALGLNRYILARYDEETFRFEIPLDYTVTVGNTIDGFTFRNVGYGQHSDVIVLRPQEIFYMDRANA